MRKERRLSTANDPQCNKSRGPQIRFSNRSMGSVMVVKEHWGHIRTWTMAALLALMTLCAYFPAIQGGFIWDDDDYVTENQTLRSIEGLKQIWLSPKATPQYYPLVHSTFWVEYQLWGIEPLGYHLTNVILHIIAALLLWRTLNMLGLPFAWVAAAVFALHPVNVESVAWITERKNVLSLVFYLCSAICMLRWLDLSEGGEKAKREWKWYGGGLIFFLAALLSKTVTCSLPAALLLIVWWRRGRIDRRALLSLLPFFFLGGVGGLSTAWLEQTHVGADGAEWDFGLTERVLIAGRAIWFHARKLIWPSELMFNYPRWTVAVDIWWQYLYPLAVIGVAVFLWAKRSAIGRGPLAAFLLFCGTLFPALGFIDVYPFRYSFVADHFQYHAGIALIAAVVVIMGRGTMRFPGRMMTALAGIVLVLLVCRTYYQCLDYADVETLWTRTIMKNDASWLAHNNLGVILHSRGEDDAAREHYLAAVRSQPNYTEALNNLGSLHASRGESDLALSYFEKALSVEPGNVLALYNLGVEYADRNEILKAMHYYREALHLDPHYASAHNNLGRLLMNQDQDDRALVHFQQAIDFAPQMVPAYLNLASLALKQKAPEKALEYLNNALALQPEDAGIHVQLGIALGRMGQAEEAIEAFRTARRLDPGNAEAQENSGIALLRQNRLTDAREAFLNAVALEPERASAYTNLADTHAALGDTMLAEKAYRQALALDPDSLRTRLNYGIFLAQSGEMEASLEHFSEATRSHPESVEACRNLAQAQWLAGQHEAARATYRALKLRSPQQAAALAGFLPEVATEPTSADGEG